MSRKYESYLVVIGCGRFGASLASRFYEQGGQVMVIDKEKDAFRKLSGSYGGLTLNGEATDIAVLKEAEVQRAGTVFVVTNNDNINMMAAQMIRYLYPAVTIICRLSDPDKKDLVEQQGIQTISPVTLLLEKAEMMLKETLR